MGNDGQMTSPEHHSSEKLSRREFGSAMNDVLSPSRPLQSEEFLRGRSEQLDGIEKAMYASGRHVLIHGLRGVGKSSLAQTAAFKLSRGADPVVVSCDRTSTFQSIIREVYDEALGGNPAVAERVREAGFSVGLDWLKGHGRVEEHERGVETPISVNDAVRLVQYLSEKYAETPVFVIDEFDLIESKQVQEDFTNLIKQVSDKHVQAHFIFCGIGESVEAIMSAHASSDRYFHAVELGQLPWEARYEVIRHAAHALKITIDRDTEIRIAMISDGFPHYVHFISEKLFWRVFEENNGRLVTSALFDEAMNDAASAMDMKLKGPYEKATQKYGDDYEPILWAAVDGHQLRRRSAEIYGSYQRVMREIGRIPLDRAKFNNRINRLKSEAHGAILTATRAGWYEFSEKMIRGYVRLRAAQQGVSLESDHPAAPRRSTD